MTGLPVATGLPAEAARTAGHAAWLAGLQAGADQPPLRNRVPLRWQGTAIGSVEPEFVSRLVMAPESGTHGLLERSERDGVTGWDIHGSLTAGLERIARTMRDAGLTHGWRDEQLAVTNADGRALGTIERAAVRPLGITTSAVHLTGRTPDGRHWVQQRALSKPNDPGLWDTLVGGMVPASDSLPQALERETWEEAGLRPDQLELLAWGGRLTTRHPSADGCGTGYLVEHIDWYRCVLPHGLEPVNQDGEVAQYRLMSADEVMHHLLCDKFTLEAALVLVAAGI